MNDVKYACSIPDTSSWLAEISRISGLNVSYGTWSAWLAPPWTVLFNAQWYKKIGARWPVEASVAVCLTGQAYA